MKSRLCTQRFSSFLRIFFLCALLFASSFSATADTWSGSSDTISVTAVNTTITLTGNTTISALWIKANNVTIDLNGYTLTVTDFYLGGETTGTDAYVTIKNSGTSGEVSIDKYDVANTTTTSLTLENVTVRVTSKYYLNTAGQGKTSINGTGTFDVTGATKGNPSDGISYPSVSSVAGSGITVVTSHSEMEVKVYYWTGATNSEWTTSTNWAANAEGTWSVKSGTYPGSADGDTAVFPNASKTAENLSLAGANYKLTIKTTSWLEQGYRITINDTGANANTADITVIGGWFLFARCTFGSVTIKTNTTLSKTLFQIYGTNANGYSLETGELNIEDTSSTLRGDLNMVLYVSGDLNNAGTINWNMKSVTVDGKFMNTGSYEPGTSCISTFNGDVENSGTITGGTGTITFGDSASDTITNSGTITLGTGEATFGGKFTNKSEATFNAANDTSGKVIFNGTVTNKSNASFDCKKSLVTFNQKYISEDSSLFVASSGNIIFFSDADFSAITDESTGFGANGGSVYIYSDSSAKFSTCAEQSFNKLYIGGNVELDISKGDLTVPYLYIGSPTGYTPDNSFLTKITGGKTLTATNGLEINRISSTDGVIGTLELDVNYSGALSMNEGTALVVDSSRTLSLSSFSSAGSSGYSCAIAVLGTLNATGALTLPFTDVYCAGTGKITAASIALTGANATTPTYIAGNLSSANTAGSTTGATGHRFYNEGTVNVTGAITGTADITNTNSFTTNGVIANSINNSGTIFESTGNISATTKITNSKTITLNNLSPASAELKMSAASIENSDLIYFQSGNTTLSFGSYTGNGSDKIVSAGGKIVSTSATSATIANLNASGTTSCEGLSEFIVDSEFKTDYGFTVTGGSLTVNGTAYLGYSGNVTTTGSQKYKGTTSLNSTVASTVKLTSDRNIDFADVEISSGNTLSFGGTGYDVKVSGDWTNNGTLSANESTVTFTDTATISGDTTFYNLALDAGGKTLTISDAQTVSGALSLNGQAGSLLSLSGSGHFVAGTADFSGKYLSIDSSVEIWKTGATAAVAGLFAVSNSEASVSSDSETVFSHGWKIGDMAFVWTGAVSKDWAVAGNWSPAIVPGATGSEGVDVTIPDGVASKNYPIAADSYSLKTLSVGSSTVTTHNATLTLSGANNINITDAASPLVNYGAIVYQSSGRLTNGTNAINDTAHDGTIKYTETSQTIAAVDYANLKISGSNVIANSAISVSGNCDISGSADFQKSLDVSGTLSLSGTGTNQFNSSGGAITSTIVSFECTMTGGSVQIGSVGDTSSTFKVTSSTLSLPSAVSAKIGGTVECASQTYNCPITLTGQPTTFKGTTVTFAGNVSSNPTVLSYGLKVDGNAVFKADVTSSGDIIVTGTTKTQGASVTLDAKGAGSTNGKMTLSGAVVLGATSTTLKSIDDMTFGSTIEGASAKSNAVTFSAKSAVLGTAKPITITGAVGSSVPLGAVSVAGGTLSAESDFGAKSLSIASACTFKAASSSTVTLSGNFSNSGTFTHNNSTVVFTDTATLSGSTTFYDLKCTTGGKTLTVSDTQNVSNTLTLKGADGNLLEISGSGTLVCSESNFSAEYLSIGGDIKIAENASSVVAGAFTAENSVPLVGVSISAVFQNGWKLSNDLAIIETIAPVGSKKIALMFNSMLYSGTGSLLTKSADLSALESEMSIEAANGETYDVEGATLVSNSENSAVIVLEISSRITLDDVKEGFVVMNATSTAFFGEGNRTLSSGTKHCVSHFVAGAVEVLYAKANSAAFDSDAYTVREFSKDAGKEGRIFFSDEDGYKITVATHVATKADANGNLDFTEDFDDSLLLFAKKSTPSSSDLTLFKNALGIQGQSAGASYLKNFSLDFSSAGLSACVSGDTVEFMFALASSDGSLFKRSADTKNDIALPVLRLSDPSDIKSLDTWRFTLSAIKAQRGGVTILNNVINSRAKEKTTIVVDTEKSTTLKVYVMTLDGSIVRTLEKSRVKSGRHTYTWDGTNGAGKSVARGMYFVRVIGDDIDETRKVMVVKE